MSIRRLYPEFLGFDEIEVVKVPAPKIEEVPPAGASCPAGEVAEEGCVSTSAASRAPDKYPEDARIVWEDA
jgi:hypothetical protein